MKKKNPKKFLLRLLLRLLLLSFLFSEELPIHFFLQSKLISFFLKKTNLQAGYPLFSGWHNNTSHLWTIINFLQTSTRGSTFFFFLFVVTKSLFFPRKRKKGKILVLGCEATILTNAIFLWGGLFCFFFEYTGRESVFVGGSVLIWERERESFSELKKGWKGSGISGRESFFFFFHLYSFGQKKINLPTTRLLSQSGDTYFPTTNTRVEYAEIELVISRIAQL